MVDCMLWGFKYGCSPRLAKRKGLIPSDYAIPTTLPAKAIRMNCLDCTGGSSSEVEKCPSTQCPLWRYRFGMKPETAAKKGYNTNVG